MSEDKSSKTNGVGSDPMQRLASFKPPRDLTLGGIKTNKKVFTPNLNVARNKNKGPKPQNNQKKDEKDRRERRNDQNRNLRNGPNIIKSSGVFSEGLGSAERHSSRPSYGSYGRESSDSVRTMQKPTIRVKDVVKIDRELEEQKIKSVLGDNSNLADDPSEDFKQAHETDAPIKLPMDDGGWSQVKPTVKVKQEVIVKREPEDVDCVPVPEVEQKPRPDVKEVFDYTDVVNLLKSDQPTLLLLQLPDSLPGRGGKVEDDGPRRKVAEEPSTSSGEGKEEKPVDNRCRLSDLEEGRIGKLRIHRSGRVSLALGDTMFEVCMGTQASCHQEVVSVGADDASRSASLVALGALQHKLNLVPHWENLFQHMSV